MLRAALTFKTKMGVLCFTVDAEHTPWMCLSDYLLGSERHVRDLVIVFPFLAKKGSKKKDPWLSIVHCNPCWRYLSFLM